MIEVIAGDINRIAPLYEKYKKPLYAYFFRLTSGDGQASEDLVHAVFYRVIKYKSSFKGEGSFASWLFRIAHNAGIDHKRKIKHLNSYKDEFRATHSDHYEQDDMEAAEQRENIERAMNKLKPEEKELLVLGKIKCLKYKEIADILDTTENNVKIRMFRAVKKLKDIYSKIESKGYEKKRL
jgi:RNA polymerase sigma-70 factor (ECF subfamily)